MIIEVLNESMLREATELLSKLYLEHKQLRQNFYDDFDNDSIRNFLIQQSSLSLVAIDEDKVVGILRGEITTTDSPFAIIHDLYVLSEYRGKCLGTKLVQSFQEQVKNKNINLIRLQVDTLNESAVSFWEKEGFSVSHLKMLKNI